MHTYICIYMIICLYLYMFICLYVYVYICIYIYMYIYICMYIYMYVCIYREHFHTHIHTYKHLLLPGMNPSPSLQSAQQSESKISGQTPRVKQTSFGTYDYVVLLRLSLAAEHQVPWIP